MKKIIAMIVLLATITANAQNEKFTAAMKANLPKFETAKTVEDFQALSATFERIAETEKTQWLPYYYAGLALSIGGWIEGDLDKDVNAGKIKAFCDKAEAIEKNSEIYTLRNMAATQQMIVDPQNRWMTYGQEASKALAKAKELDPNNPRIYYLEAMGIFGTPEQFGGGKANAKPIFEKAVELYKNEKPKPLYPDWGKKEAEAKLAECQ